MNFYEGGRDYHHRPEQEALQGCSLAILLPRQYFVFAIAKRALEKPGREAAGELVAFNTIRRGDWPCKARASDCIELWIS